MRHSCDSSTFWWSSAASPGRGQVVAEGFLDHYSRVGAQAGCGQSLYYRAEQERGNFEVEHRTSRPTDRRCDPLVGFRVGEVALHVGQPVDEPGEDLVVEGLACRDDGAACALDELLAGPVIDRDTYHGTGSNPRSSSRYNDRKVITRARSPVMPKTTKTSATVGVPFLPVGGTPVWVSAAITAPRVARVPSRDSQRLMSQRRPHPPRMMDSPTALTTMGGMTENQHYDVAIIGTGAGGGTLGHRLAAAGKRVLWLKRGPFLPRELDNWDSEAVFVRGKYLAPEQWYDGRGHEFHPRSTTTSGATRSSTALPCSGCDPKISATSPIMAVFRRPGPSTTPTSSPTTPRRSISMRCMECMARIPTEGAASAPYAYGPVSHEPRIQQLSDDLEKLGLHPFHLPIGVRLDEDAPGRASRHSACIRCSKVDGFPCLVGAKCDSQSICVEPSLQLDNVTLVTEANVHRLETDPTGRTVTQIVTEMADGEMVSFSADMVVVACGAVNSAALLLRSTATTHPDGLANRSGVVGRYYMRHNNVAVMAVSEEPNPTIFQKTLAMNDWYLGADDWDYPLGGIQMLGKSDDVMIHAEAPRWAGKLSPDLPFEVLAHHAVDFWLCGEDLPRGDSRVTLDKGGAIHLDIDETNNVEGVKRLRHKLDGMLGSLGLHRRHLLDHSLYLHKSMPIGATAHQAGTVRFGTEPLDSALDPNCRAHDVDNLYVVDTSFFPSIGAVNPSLTAMANALRVGDHLLERLG